MNGQTKRTINVNGRLIDLSTPKIMGILNVTPDSFYAGSRKETEADITARIEQILTEGADIIDIGAYSSRTNAIPVTTEEESTRLRRGLEIIRKTTSDVIVSVDTFRADVAAMCVEEYNAAIINDISGGQMDKQMFNTVARLNVPYIMMHMKGTPQNMQHNPSYNNLRTEIMQYFAERIQILHSRGVKDIIIDPGFGFGKTQNHNYELFRHLEDFQLFEQPILVGISRKSMIYNLLECTPDEALNGTTVLNTLALTKGASILRVHDVKACAEAVRIFNQMNQQP
ncbi:dihydropteroate synthase [Phocaeicola sartorii]|uniref:dihydropteroate synthase n=1 Tax=Phocaeicola sartorii TaxID=671267 RepID=UPI00258735F0|nr:dihydropteroate synthase [Phocaeicola sartorii]